MLNVSKSVASLNPTMMSHHKAQMNYDTTQQSLGLVNPKMQASALGKYEAHIP
jgi:hypothetical protein